jgi:hypothetical protein
MSLVRADAPLRLLISYDDDDRSFRRLMAAEDAQELPMTIANVMDTGSRAKPNIILLARTMSGCPH